MELNRLIGLIVVCVVVVYPCCFGITAAALKHSKLVVKLLDMVYKDKVLPGRKHKRTRAQGIALVF